MTSPSILWLRRDLRLADQAALVAACAAGPVVPVYILDDETAKHRAMGGASRWWLHHSLAGLDADLRKRGSRLILRRGRVDAVLTELATELKTRSVHALAHYEPWWINAERAVAKALDLTLHDGNYLLPPGALQTGGGQPYKIFTPFWRALSQHMPPPKAVSAPKHIPAPSHWPKSDDLNAWALLPTKPDWAQAFGDEWTPGEAGAMERLADFGRHVAAYDDARNLPSREGTSRLSPHLHFGEISPATLWHALAEHKHAGSYLRELGWRDYAQNVILQLPDYGRANGMEKFDKLPWRTGKAADTEFDAWTKGRTGYPIVDAGMRQLWATGWMHNRVRMIAASFLIKHLLIDWRRGEQWFWDTLVDADYGNNSVNWQWSAGSGIDANMFVRVMAPLTQSEKFDAGDYIRQWVPELAGIRGKGVHDPEEYGCRPVDYPAKIIGHREGRERALRAFEAIRG